MAQKPATTRIPRQLRESDVHGKGAAEIGWGTPGDFDRCRAFMRRHNVPGYEIDGACANLHRLATGEWPGPNAHKGHLATAAVISLTAAMGTYNPITWEGPLARIEEPTGDRRQFPRDTLQYQSFPQPFRFQRVGLPGHQGAITVGVIKDAAERDVDAAMATDYGIKPGRYVWGNGYFLDPNVVPEVTEAVHLAEHGVSGPSVDLDSYTAVLKRNTLSGETTASMVRGRQRAATLVPIPAFADLRIKVVHPKALAASAEPSTEGEPDTSFAVNGSTWHGAPIAPREALFDADDAAKRIEAWANGDPKKMASMFLWIDDTNGPLLGRKGYRLPWGDIIDNKPYLIYHAVYAAAALLQGGHGGLPNIPEEEKGKLRTIISSIYENLASEFNDPSIQAPWDRAEQQQASGEPEPWTEATGDEYDSYVYSYTAALEEFVRHHRYREALHPRDQRKDDHAGEWIDTPHGPHGQIKVGGKWVYPPKRGEKGYKNPERAAQDIAERGGGKKTTVAKKKPETKKPETKKATVARRSTKSDAQVGDTVEWTDENGKTIRGEVVGANGTSIYVDWKNGTKAELISRRDATVRKVSGEKKPETQKEPSLSERLTLRLARDAGEEGIIKSKLPPGAREHVDGLTERGLLAEKKRGFGSRYYITSKGRESLKGHEDEEPKGPKAPQSPRKKTTVVRKSTGEVKEHKLSSAQQSALERLREDENAKIHPATRRVLEREDYLDSNGKLTQKSRDHLGVKETSKKETSVKETPKKATKTIVAKKTATAKPAKKSIEEHVKALEGIQTREEADKYLEDNKLTNAELRGIAQAQGKKPTSSMTKAQLTELVGRGAPMRGSQKTVETTLERPKKETPPKVKTPKLSAKETLEARKKENAQFLRTETDEEKVVERLTAMNRSELIAAYKDEELNPIGGAHGSTWSDDELRQKVLNLWKHKQRQAQNRERDKKIRQALTERAIRLASYKERVKAADEAHHEAVIRHRTRNPLVVTGYSTNRWENRVPEDTGPLGIPVRDLTIDGDGVGGGYVVKSGRLIKRGGVAYLIEDRDDTMADEMADFLESVHKELPGADKLMRGYAWLHGDSPNDAYWQKRFGNSEHRAAASSGDGIMRFWGPGNEGGLEEQRKRAKHEFGHNVDNLVAASRGSGSDSARWRRSADKDREVGFPVGWQWNGVRRSPEKSKGAEDREVPYGVTDYGKSSWMEDYAESTDMYLQGAIGSAAQGISKRVPVYFRDLFPHRASALDEMFPEIARKQLEEIRRRGPLTFLPR
jgi:hypothetical protein